MSMKANKNGGQQEHGPTRSCGQIEMQRFEYWVSGSRGRLDWKNKTERDAVGGVEQKTE